MMSRPGHEIQIDWLPHGESQRRRHNDVLEPISNKVFDETVKRREAERAAEGAAAERFLAETRRLLLDLADAVGCLQGGRGLAQQDPCPSLGRRPARQHGQRDRV